MEIRQSQHQLLEKKKANIEDVKKLIETCKKGITYELDFEHGSAILERLRVLVSLGKIEKCKFKSKTVKEKNIILVQRIN